MPDRYLNLVNSPVGSAVASRVGLPRPAVLRRYEPGAPLVPGPVLVGSTSGAVDPRLSGLLAGLGIETATSAADDERWGALVLDARAVATP
ncbi:MAG: 3-oxoacyl-[acyl-carrier protein] reductase, partial [Pseudonocardiales bacterium]|nr:3-oxoacyl-[acyl-carrier protein] reductase [Pseudonocardiales bacterium]